jgi:hypothetical protein
VRSLCCEFYGTLWIVLSTAFECFFLFLIWARASMYKYIVLCCIYRLVVKMEVSWILLGECCIYSRLIAQFQRQLQSRVAERYCNVCAPCTADGCYIQQQTLRQRNVIPHSCASRIQACMHAGITASPRRYRCLLVLPAFASRLYASLCHNSGYTSL